MAGVNVSIGADSRKASRELKKFEKKSHSVAKSIAKGFKERIGHKLFDGFLGAASRVPGLLMEAVDSASDLNEEVSKSQTIFTTSAKEIRSWASGSAEAMGMSEVAALEASGTIGNMFVAMGMASQKAADMSMSMVGLASDLGSFNNTSTEDAITAISAALRGESEPIRRYGVLLNEATLKAEAFAMGLYEGKGALDPTTKAQAAYNVILKQTTTAQGDFQKTSDGLANSQKIVNAQLEDAKAKIGEQLLPAMQSLVNVLKDADFTEAARQIGILTKYVVDFAGTVYDAAKAYKEFVESIAGTTELNIPQMRISGDFDAPEEDPAEKRYREAMEWARNQVSEKKKLAQATEKEREETEKIAKAYEVKLSKLGFELDMQNALLEKEKERLKVEEERERKADRASERADLRNKELEALSEFGNASQKKANRVSELLDMGFSQSEANSIAGKEKNIEDLFQTRDKLQMAGSRFSNLAISSMQRIGGGGGVSSELGLQKRQAELQQKMVNLLQEIKDSANQPVSDF